MDTKLDQIIQQWVSAVSRQNQVPELELAENHALETVAQVKLVGQALALIPSFPLAGKHDEEGAFNNPLMDLLFLAPTSSTTAQAVVEYVLPEVRRLVDDALLRTEEGIDTDLLITALKPLAGMQQQEDIARVISAARSSNKKLEQEYFWSNTFTYFDPSHPHSLTFYKQIAQQLPQGFCALALLHAIQEFWVDEKGQMLIQKEGAQHPFDQGQGVEMLRNWLSDHAQADEGYACLAVDALPFITTQGVDELYQLAAQFPDPYVRIEAAWASIETQQPHAQTSLQYLVQAAQQYETSRQACMCLEDLGLAEHIPFKVLNDAEFLAQVERHHQATD